jgi:hypothetical protein
MVLEVKSRRDADANGVKELFTRDFSDQLAILTVWPSEFLRNPVEESMGKSASCVNEIDDRLYHPHKDRGDSSNPDFCIPHIFLFQK